jgi:hypothetical protein
MPMPKRMGSIALLILLTPLLTAACAPNLAAQSTSSGCRPADQVRTTARLGFLKDLVSSSDPDHVASRQDLGIPSMSPTRVKLVTRQQDCQAAITAMNTVRQEPGKVRQVWLYALGTAGYALDDPGLDVAYTERILIFFDPKFVYKVTYSGF